jgi:hypothetical protein
MMMTQNAVPKTATTPPLHREPEAGSTTAVALQRAVAHLMGLQQDDGWWRGELETKVTMDAEDLLLQEFLRIRGAADTEEAAHCIRSQQRDDGTWATFYGGPEELSTCSSSSRATRPTPAGWSMWPAGGKAGATGCLWRRLTPTGRADPIPIPARSCSLLLVL